MNTLILDNKKLWESVLVELELTVSKATFVTWFKDTAIMTQEAGAVEISVPNAFVKDWLLKKYHKFILKALRDLAGDIRSVDYVIAKEDSRKKEQENQNRQQNTLTGNSGELPLQDFYINKEDNLNPKYTFESFVVGPFNELAHAAAQAVMKKPGTQYNPLFIYGDTGHGKTHLIQSVGNYFKTHHSNKKVFYVTSEKFLVDYVNSLQTNKTQAFKEKYRKYDILIMDDIQFLSGKEKIQEELFHLFNVLFDNNKQLIFSSDKSPNFIPNIEERLKSRLLAGMIVDIPPPDKESRMAILKAKSELSKVALLPEVLEYLATSVEGNIRELEGVLNVIICQTELKNKDISLTEVKNLVKNSIKPKKTVSSKDIIKIIADFYKIDEESIYEKTRKKEIVKPRQLIMYILREDYNVSYPSIGQKLGGRDHTTVMHSCEKIKKELKVDNSLTEELEQIRALI